MPHCETERALTASATASKPNIECHNIARFFPPSTWALKMRPSASMKANRWPLPAPPEAENLRSLSSSGYSISLLKVS